MCTAVRGDAGPAGRVVGFGKYICTLYNAERQKQCMISTKLTIVFLLLHDSIDAIRDSVRKGMAQLDAASHS